MTTKYTLGSGYYSTHHTIARLIGENNMVLDVGCNKGYLGQVAHQSNIFYGVDYSAHDIIQAKKRYKKVFRTDLNINKKLPWKKCKFDVIVFADVLEHLVNPTQVLNYYSRIYLNKGGRVIVSVPNIANWYIRFQLLFGHFDPTVTGIMDKTHLHFYTYKTARDLLYNAGLTVTKEYAGASLFGPITTVFPFTRHLFASSIILEGIMLL